MLLPREKERGNKAKKEKKELCPWEGDNNFNRAHSRNPQTSPRPRAPVTLTQPGAATATHNILLGLQPELGSPSERTQVLQLPRTCPNYLLLLVHQQHCSLLQDLTLSCQVRGCLLRLNKGNIVAEVFRLYSVYWRWQGLWILITVLQFFFSSGSCFFHKKLAGSGHYSHIPGAQPFTFLVRSRDSKQLGWPSQGEV